MRISDYLQVSMAAICERLVALEGSGFDDQDLGALARDAAALWEASLKASHGGWASQGSSLFDMTNLLESQGWTHAVSLHEVRKAANKDKHDSQARHDSTELKNVMQDLMGGIATLPSALPGALQEAPERIRRRRMVCAIYDLFASGETLYSFMDARPEDTWRSVRHIDSFEVNNQDCKEVEAKLALLPEWLADPQGYDQLCTSLRESDHELYRIATLTTSYEQVHTLMAPFQHDRPLLAGLHREDDTQNIVASTVAAVIASSEPSTVGRRPALAADINRRVTEWLASVPKKFKPLTLDRCNMKAFMAAAPGAVLVDHELGMLVTHKGLVLVLSR